MAQDSDMEKTEQASTKRLEQAREEGDVPRSRELATCSLLMTAGLSLWVSGESLVRQLSMLLTSSLSFERSAAFDMSLLQHQQINQLIAVMQSLGPIAGALILVAMFSPVLIGGWLFSGHALSPNFARMNPIAGLGNMVSVRALVELGKALGKAFIVGTVAWKVIRYQQPAIVGLVGEPIRQAAGHVGYLLIVCFISITSGLVLIAAIDVPYQLWNYAKKLRMTRQELIQESKESNGNPQIKAKLRAQRREMARRRMMSKIPTADVVVTNPTHYAVALKYVEGRMSAPVVVAKGADVIAGKIREIAKEHGITVLESPPLARALFAHAELDEQIPEALYIAVAEVLAYVFQLRSYQSNGGLVPQVPKEINVPDELDPALTPVAPSRAAATPGAVNE